MVQKIHDWDTIDPLIFEGEMTMVSIAEKFKISYRSITNRKYQVRDRFERRLKRKVRFDEVYKFLKKNKEKKGAKREKSSNHR